MHLDLDHLGSTDVSVRMRGREDKYAGFYLDNDTAYALLGKKLSGAGSEAGKKRDITVRSTW